MRILIKEQLSSLLMVVAVLTFIFCSLVFGQSPDNAKIMGSRLRLTFIDLYQQSNGDLAPSLTPSCRLFTQMAAINGFATAFSIH